MPDALAQAEHFIKSTHVASVGLGTWNQYLLIFATGLAICLVFVWLVRERIATDYGDYVPTQSLPLRYPRDLPYLLLALSAFAAICLLISHTLRDFYVDSDSMSKQLQFFLAKSATPQVWSGRFFPLAHVDNFLVYKLISDFSLIKYYLFAHLAITLYVAFRAFDYVPPRLRLLVLTLFTLAPPIANIYSSPIYSERNIILLLLLAFLLFRRAFSAPRFQHILVSLSAFCVFLSLFFKEPTVLAVSVFAVGAYVLRNARGALTNGAAYPKFSQPFRSLEFLLIIMLALWFVAFALKGGEPAPDYVSRGWQPLAQYLAHNRLDVACVSLFCIFMLLRRKADIYALVWLTSLPMFLYQLALYRSVGAVNVYPYYNYLAYLAFFVYLTSLQPPRSYYVVGATLLASLLVTGYGFLHFSDKVSAKEKVFAYLLDQSQKHGISVHIDLKTPWEDAAIARYLIYRSPQIRVTQFEQPGDEALCQDTELYNVRKSCMLVSEIPPGSLVLTHASSSQIGVKVLDAREWHLYRTAGKQ